MRSSFALIAAITLAACHHDVSQPVVPPPAPAAARAQDASIPRRTANGGASSTSVPTPDVSLDAEAVQQVSFAVGEACTREFSSRVRGALNSYDRLIDMERGPTCHERYLSEPHYALRAETSRCASAVAQVPASEVELASAAHAYLEAIQRLAPLLADVDGYYDREAYRLDDCAHGRELHPQLAQAFAAFTTADADLEALSAQIETRAIDARLARLEADPAHQPEYLTELALDRARRMMLLVLELRVSRGQLVGDDVDAVREAIEAYRVAVDGLANGHLETIDPSSAYRAAASTLLADAQGVLRRLDGERFDSRERFLLAGRAPEVFGSPGRALGSYNHLVEAYNHRMRRTR